MHNWKIKIGSDTYCNGAEKYANGEWENYINFDILRNEHVAKAIKLSGLECKVNTSATQIDGVTPTEKKMLAVWIPVGEESRLDDFFDVNRKLKDAYRNYLVNEKHIDPQKLEGLSTYIGCEEEYELF